MGFLDSMGTSVSGMTAQRHRVQTISENIANSETTRTAEGGPYRRRDVVLASDAVGAFDNTLQQAGATGVRVAAIVDDRTAFRRRYEPSHPDADGDGFVALPNVEPAEEMVDMLSAARAYQANLTAITLVREMLQKALELGR
jgi:flagellar basal-body rod protein FlgC